MGNILYFVAIIMIAFWAVGFFAYGAGSVIHILLVIALVSVLVQMMTGRR